MFAMDGFEPDRSSDGPGGRKPAAADKLAPRDTFAYIGSIFAKMQQRHVRRVTRVSASATATGTHPTIFGFET
jgi:hypothetical protein